MKLVRISFRCKYQLCLNGTNRLTFLSRCRCFEVENSHENGNKWLEIRKKTTSFFCCCCSCSSTSCFFRLKFAKATDSKIVKQTTYNNSKTHPPAHICITLSKSYCYKYCNENERKTNGSKTVEQRCVCALIPLSNEMLFMLNFFRSISSALLLCLCFCVYLYSLNSFEIIYIDTPSRRDTKISNINIDICNMHVAHAEHKHTCILEVSIATLNKRWNFIWCTKKNWNHLFRYWDVRKCKYLC